MALRDDLHTLPDGLPVPVDDGRCDHLTGTGLPAVALASTGGYGAARRTLWRMIVGGSTAGRVAGDL